MEMLYNFEKNGFAVIEDFLDDNEVAELISACAELVENMNPTDHPSIFQTGKNQVGDEYFLNSGDKIAFFFEKDAVDEKGELVVDKDRSLNKIGHALHWLNPVFKKITFSDKIKDLAACLGYKDPVIAQSMYIFKHPKIGGEVVPHQDSAYLYTSPLSTLGLWFPLVDVSEENGCLYFVPGSHRGPVPQRFVRNPAKDPLLVLQGEMEKFDDSSYVPVPVKKGSCVIIHGSVLHKSDRNTSKHSRPVYTFHIVENKNTDYDRQNWLQPSEELPFPSLFKCCSETKN